MGRLTQQLEKADDKTRQREDGLQVRDISCLSLCIFPIHTESLWKGLTCTLIEDVRLFSMSETS